MTRFHLVKKARKEGKTDSGETIPVGSPYYWWKFRYGGMHKSLSQPTARQLTQNEFQHAIMDFEDAQAEIDIESLKTEGSSVVDSLKEPLETLRDEQQDKLDNMPEQLQESSESGQMLQERIDALEEMIDSLDSVDVPDEELAPDASDDDKADLEERFESALEDIQNVSYGGP